MMRIFNIRASLDCCRFVEGSLATPASRPRQCAKPRAVVIAKREDQETKEPAIEKKRRNGQPGHVPDQGGSCHSDRAENDVAGSEAWRNGRSQPPPDGSANGQENSRLDDRHPFQELGKIRIGALNAARARKKVAAAPARRNPRKARCRRRRSWRSSDPRQRLGVGRARSSFLLCRISVRIMTWRSPPCGIIAHDVAVHKCLRRMLLEVSFKCVGGRI